MAERKTLAVYAVVLVVCVLIAYFAGTYTTQPTTVMERVEVTKPYVCPKGKIWVPILNKFMTHEELVEEIKKEGEVVIADWTYWGLTDTYFIPTFKKYVKEAYGVDVEVTIVGTQAAKGGFMYQLYSAYAAGMPAPYDVMHIEINFFEEAVNKGIAEPYLPSPLIPNLVFVDPFFQHLPYGVNTQQHAYAAPVVNLEKAGWIESWLDLADPRLKGKITLWPYTDNGLWGFFVAVATALGYDYKNETQMKEALKWAAENIGPNVLKYTDDETEIIELSEKNITWVTCYWCCNPEMEQAAGNKWLGPKMLEPFMPCMPGVLWIPKDCQHPVLAQLWVNFELSPEFQMPDINSPGFKELDPTEAKKLWAGMVEGPLGPYYEQFIPDWWGGKENFYKAFPTIEEVKEYYFPIDWQYVNKHAEEWCKYYDEHLPPS